MPLFDEASELLGELHTEAFGESITYTPASGSPRTIYAVVERNGTGTVNSADKIRAWRYRVTVRNHATYGVSASATTTLRGTFTIAKRIGHADTETLTITTESLQNQSAGLLTFAWE